MLIFGKNVLEYRHDNKFPKCLLIYDIVMFINHFSKENIRRSSSQKVIILGELMAHCGDK